MPVEDSVLLACEYFPSIAWCREMRSFEHVVLEQYEYFVRKTGRNRCVVCGPNGPVTLSVPLLGGRNQKTRMKDVRISYAERWPLIHWRTLDACYRRTPFFEAYEEDVRALLESRPVFLLDLNLASIDLLVRKLKLGSVPEFTESYQQDLPPGVIDRRSLLSEPGLAMHPYPQPFSERHGFVSGLSMLDLLFCCGPASPSYFKVG